MNQPNTAPIDLTRYIPIDNNGQARYEDADFQIDTLDDLVTSVKDDPDAWLDVLHNLRNEMNNSDVMIRDLEADVASNNQDLSNMRAEAARLRTRCDTLQVKVDQYAKKVADHDYYREQANKQRDAKKKALEEVQSLKARIIVLEANKTSAPAAPVYQRDHFTDDEEDEDLNNPRGARGATAETGYTEGGSLKVKHPMPAAWHGDNKEDKLSFDEWHLKITKRIKQQIGSPEDLLDAVIGNTTGSAFRKIKHKQFTTWQEALSGLHDIYGAHQERMQYRNKYIALKQNNRSFDDFYADFEEFSQFSSSNVSDLMEDIRDKMSGSLSKAIENMEFTDMDSLVAAVRRIEQRQKKDHDKGYGGGSSNNNNGGGRRGGNPAKNIGPAPGKDAAWWEKANHCCKRDYDWTKMPFKSFKDRTAEDAEKIGRRGCWICRTPDHHRNDVKCPVYKFRIRFPTPSDKVAGMEVEEEGGEKGKNGLPSYDEQLKD
jgi:hypothetical protein